MSASVKPSVNSSELSSLFENKLSPAERAGLELVDAVLLGAKKRAERDSAWRRRQF